MAGTGRYKALRGLQVIILLVGLLQASRVGAACGWRQPSGESSSPAGGAIVLRAIGWKLVANKHWYEDGRFAVGSLMGTDETTFNLAGGCTHLRELAGGRVEVVYVPPANAVPHGRGYRLKPDALGVAVDIEFPAGTPHPAGIALARSAQTVGAGGVLATPGFAAPITLRITLVKTGAFTGTGEQSLLKVAGDLGRLRYYKLGDAGVLSQADNVLQLPASYGTEQQAYIGRAQAPHCTLTRLGNLPSGAGPKVIRLTAVSAQDFSGPGALGRSAGSTSLRFSCEGADALKPVFYLEASYPFDNGRQGVGMPARDSDVGVQVLFDEQPVRLGEVSRALAWSPKPLDSVLADGQGGFVSPQGLYCRGECASDMRGPSWINGGASQGDNQGQEAQLTFRYYQTSEKRPVPRTFSVPFTLSLDVQ